MVKKNFFVTAAVISSLCLLGGCGRVGSETLPSAKNEAQLSIQEDDRRAQTQEIENITQISQEYGQEDADMDAKVSDFSYDLLGFHAQDKNPVLSLFQHTLRFPWQAAGQMALQGMRLTMCSGKIW